MTDVELLEQHRGGDESAFADLVRRHVGWVHGVARRRLNDPHLAEDVAQAVFVLLHRKAPRFSADSAMIGWLHKTAWYATETVARTERRRRVRETEAVVLRDRAAAGEERQSVDLQWEQLAPALDQLIERLNRADREALLLRYYRDMSFAEVAEQTGTTAEAARKRVGRAIDKLRRLAMAKGVDLSVAALGLNLAAIGGATAPPGLVATATVAATAPAGSAMAGSSGVIAKATSSLMLTSKIGTGAAAAASLAVEGGVIWGTIQYRSAQETPAPPAPVAEVAPVASAAPPAPVIVAVRGAPYSAVRWAGRNVQVRVDGTWYELMAIDGVPAARIIIGLEPDPLGRKHFCEDLPMVMANLGDQVGSTVQIQGRRLDSGATVDLNNVPMSMANRSQLVRIPTVLGTATRTIFSAVRWVGSTPQIQVNGDDTWYELTGMNDLPAETMTVMAREKYGDAWQKKFAEDSVELLNAMEPRPMFGQYASLQAKAVDGGELYTLYVNVFAAPQPVSR
jgi:RNA polymerase sigma factor (sigma-70 family)